MSLGHEAQPAVTIGRPRFRDTPGPPTAAILFVPFAALAAFGYLTYRAAQLSPGFCRFMAGRGHVRSKHESAPGPFTPAVAGSSPVGLAKTKARAPSDTRELR